MNQSLILALLPLVGVGFGAFLQSLLQLRKDRVTQNQNLKVKAYTDYLQAAAILSGKDVTKHNEARVLLTDAKARILIYGSLKVISNIAAFDRAGSNLITSEGMKAFLQIPSSMREDDLKGKISQEDMSQILFSRDSLDA